MTTDAKPKPRPRRADPDRRAGRPPPDGSDLARLTDAQRTRVESCAWAQREMEREPTLRDLLVTIEGAVNATAALQAARAKDPRFADFVDRLLVEVGACAFEDDGTVAFVGAGGEPPEPGAGKPQNPIYHGGMRPG